MGMGMGIRRHAHGEHTGASCDILSLSLSRSLVRPPRLKLFTNLGLLMHFDTPALRDVVVLKTQWLLDVMCELLCLRSIGAKLKRAKSKAPEWRRLRRSGRLDTALLPEIWPTLSAEQRDTMLAYMVKFGLACTLPVEASYAVPALLPLCTAGTTIWPSSPTSKDAHASLRFIHSDGEWDEATGFLPNGLFFSLVAALLRDVGDVKAALKHLYRDRICIHASQLFMAVLHAQEHRVHLTVRAEAAHDPADVYHILGKYLLEGGIAKRYGVQFRLYAPCRECGTLVHAQAGDWLGGTLSGVTRIDSTPMGVTLIAHMCAVGWLLCVTSRGPLPRRAMQ